MSRKVNNSLDLNTISEKDLIKVLRISPRLAKRILALRPFSALDQVNAIWGIDRETLDKIGEIFVFPENIDEKREGADEEIELPVYLTEHLEKVKPEASEKPIGRFRKFVAALLSTDDTAEPEQPKPSKPPFAWKPALILAVILVVGAIFRFSGLNWDEGFHQHPDERYMTMVAEQIRPVSGFSTYFDTANSTLNPLKHGSYTYGMLPLFVTRMVAQWVNMASYDSITLVGRFLSGLFDLAAIWALYLLALRLYNRKVALLAAALFAAAVFPIQMSHFFTVDSFATVFVILSFYTALHAIPLDKPGRKVTKENLKYFAYFGFLVGLAGACKVNTLPVIAILFLAAAIYLLIEWKQPNYLVIVVRIAFGLLLAVLLTALAFRVFQPYAFNGPSITNFSLNERWLSVIKEVTNQVAGNSEWPPNHHWTNRPIQYSWVNMVVWGMGIPLGLAAWAGWAWAGVRIWKRDWRKHLFPFVWVLLYFIWQNMQFWRYMRYFLPIYPFLIMFAAWALMEIYAKSGPSLERIGTIGRDLKEQIAQFKNNWHGFLSVLVIAVVLLGTYAYALAFSNIYRQPHTRVAASRWILQNIEGPLNVKLESASGLISYPIPTYNNHVFEPEEAQVTELKLRSGGTVSQITAPQIKRLGGSLFFKVSRDPAGEDRVTDGRVVFNDDETREAMTVNFGDVTLETGQPYYFYYRFDNSNIMSFGAVRLGNENDESPGVDLPLVVQDQSPGLAEDTFKFSVETPVRINRLKISNFSQEYAPSAVKLSVSILKDRDEENPLASAETSFDFSAPGEQRSARFEFPTVELSSAGSYQIKTEVVEGSSIQLLAENFTLETSWDDALPLAVDKIDALGGIYSPLNLELYEADTPEKREKMLDILARSEYIVLPSNRAYDAMPRLELRYPLTLKYYQLLFGCECSSDAMEARTAHLKPPFASPLGFDLVAAFESYPTLGPIQLNDQLADESFTVYDHPKVMIFKKSADFSLEKVRAAFEAVNLDQVIFQVPLNYTRAPTALMLPADRLEAQTLGGTWSKMFDRLSLINQNEGFTIIVWYLLLLFMGWLVLPLTSRLFRSLPDRGYPFVRMISLLMMAWLPWLLGSLKLVTFSRLLLFGCLILFAAINGLLFYRGKSDFIDYFKKSWRHIIVVEIIFAVLFIFSLNIRLGNPDLWHPWLGGEKPMDFAFFNAVIKSVYFPPENPWFSGHYLNYYYYGYVIAAIPTKLLGVLPSLAYNLVLPSWFAMTGVGVFGVGYNLYTGIHGRLIASSGEQGEHQQIKKRRLLAGFISKNGTGYFVGVFALVAALFFANFFEVKLLWKYLPEAANLVDSGAPTGKLEQVLSGASQVLSGDAQLPGDPGRWYFAASRPILPDGPDTPIAEFPYFSFLYADLHPHLLSMPFYALPLTWCLSLILLPLTKRKWPEKLLALLMAGLFFGVFRASHTWDFPTFLALGLLTMVWTTWSSEERSLEQKLKTTFFYVVALVVMAMLFYSPFTHWFKTEYASIELWKGLRTPLNDYVVVYGLSLFIMLSMLIKTIWPEIQYIYKRWFKIRNWSTWIPSIIIFAVIYAMFQLWKNDYQVLAFGLPLIIAWVYIIFFKKSVSELERLTWLLFAVAYGLTYVVELVVLKGDVGRSNMVFRFYIEAWFILAIAMGLALVTMYQFMKKWLLPLRALWISAVQVLILLSLVYPLVATGKKINDRWPGVQLPPRTLDGSAFMLGDSIYNAALEGAIYNDEGRPIDLSLDYYAIHYLQDNVQGSPVIVEGHTTEYRWGARYAIHTGLPSVIGWSWHTRQHNSLIEGSIIEKRIEDVVNFYNTTSIEEATQFLKKYEVKYIIVSGLERVYYSSEGLEKFNEMERQGLLRIVFGQNNEDSAIIYEVIQK
ncbi:MAG: hypothetical protein BGO78_13315 [Chloroflexi bacterium 44-23]|nr:MAG: hypothetical protein BGO78_13315 [Chloroflexi bacterium 44-23]